MADQPEPDDECGPIEDVPAAKGIAFSVCEHGTVHLVLLDENDKPFATAPMPVENWLDMVDSVGDEIDELIESCEDEPAPTHELSETRH